jgi:hypothetical protein
LWPIPVALVLESRATAADPKRTTSKYLRINLLPSKNWKDLAELVGIAAIVASLIFVGLEMRQSQQIALASQYQVRTDSGRQYFYESLASEYRIKDLAEDIQTWDWPPGFLSEAENQWLEDNPPSVWAEAAYWATINLYGFDNYYYQYQSGLLSEEGWLALRSRLRGLLNDDPFARYLIVTYGEDFRSSFRNLALTIVTEIPDE